MLKTLAFAYYYCVSIAELHVMNSHHRLTVIDAYDTKT